MRVFICMAILGMFNSLEIANILELSWPFKFVMVTFMFLAFIQDVAEIGRK